jgi:hypothetical protein
MNSETYNRNQSRCGIQRGDLVRVTRLPKPDEQGWTRIFTNPYLLVGMTGKVSHLCIAGVRVLLENGCRIHLPFFILEVISTLQTRKASEILSWSNRARAGEMVQFRSRFTGGEWKDLICPGNLEQGPVEMSLQFRIRPETPEEARDKRVAEWNAKGKTGVKVQFRCRHSEGFWTGLCGSHTCDDVNIEFRVKPEPKYRPWNKSEVPVGRGILKNKVDPDDGYRTLILAVNYAGKVSHLSNDSQAVITSETLEELLEFRLVSLDGGKTFVPCGVEVYSDAPGAQLTPE